MSNRCNNQGRAYEFACLSILQKRISAFRQVQVLQTGGYGAASAAWNLMTPAFRQMLLRSADAAVDTIFEMEPLIVENGNDMLTLQLQADVEGERGDVRDIRIIRRSIQWEIGLSIKHNHFAVKHSRLSATNDFCCSWFGSPCTREYRNEVSPVFRYVSDEAARGLKWADLPNKERDVYIPLLTAFMNEVRRQNAKNPHIPRKMVEYLLGEFDFYKVISIDKEQLTSVQAFNLYGTLNRNGEHTAPRRRILRSTLPTRIVAFDFKRNSKTTVEMYMDNGWQFSFRIHRADNPMIPSLKFDVQIIGMPTTIITINCRWKFNNHP